MKREEKMKKTIILILSLTLLLTACGVAPETIEFGENRLYSESFTSEDGAVYFQASAVIPSVSGGKRAEAIDAALEELFEKEKEAAASYRATALDSYNFAKENNMEVSPCAYDASCQPGRADEKCLSFIGLTYLNMGGVHPDTIMWAVNFDKNGEKMEIGDLFSVPQDEYMARVKELVSAEIEAERADWYYENWREILMDSWMLDDFIVGEEGLTVFWQDYAIGPYASGTPEFELAWGDLEDILAEEWK